MVELQTILPWLMLFVLGVAIGCAGTLIGAGGGFILMPVLVLLYPHDDPVSLASISLAVVFANAASGTAGYVRQRRIDFRAGTQFSLAAAPGAVLGAIATGMVPRRAFGLTLGTVLTVISLFLALVGTRRSTSDKSETPIRSVGNDGDTVDIPPTGAELEHRANPRIAFDPKRGAAISFVVGFVSSLLGIGGGIVHVPALILMLGFPTHIATATSHFVLAVTALAGTVVHIVTGSFHQGWRRTGVLGAGVIIGAQIGAWLSSRTPNWLIERGLAVALAVVGIRVIVASVL